MKMPPKKASIGADDVMEMLDTKLKTLKTDIVNEVKDSLIQALQQKLREKDDQIIKLESQVAMLQTHVNNLKHVQDKKIEELEQYGRRLCLRVDGVPCKAGETSDQVLNTIRDQIKEVRAEIPDVVIDRAHRIGSPYYDEEAKMKKQPIIVRFTTFRHRTMFYHHRKFLR